ncbi:MAG: ATP-dependent 6-phosphofructokinase [Lactobacillales bacterium]|jgi:6-phosphofructokinase 1|nr:ATP-dependent 6-phosphofructokinase [Lactobacillales bacterium]
MTQKKRIGVLTSGGDCSGLNAAIRAVTFSATTKGWEVIGIHNATDGLFSRPMRYQKLTLADFEFPYATLGGTMLGTNNFGKPYPQKEDGTYEELSQDELNKRFKDGIEELGLSAMIVIGGDGSQSIVGGYCRRAGISVIGIPKTIDNDTPGTELSIGFSTARSVVMDALDKIDTTASSHHRVMVVEVMGRGAGHLALESGIAGFADAILIPEVPYNYDNLVAHIKKLKDNGKQHSLIVVAQGVKMPDGKACISTVNEGGVKIFGGISEYFTEKLRQDGFNVRGNILGHMQRAGSPVASDRLVASSFAVKAIDLLCQGKTNRMVVFQDGAVTDLDINDVLKIGNYPVDPNGSMVQVARNLGIYVGEVK